TFVTQYSLSNDGNYVEVLALGTWALWLAARFGDEPEHRSTLALAAGLLLGPHPGRDPRRGRGPRDPPRRLAGGPLPALADAGSRPRLRAGPGLERGE